jgi:hypothetical protein
MHIYVYSHIHCIYVYTIHADMHMIIHVCIFKDLYTQTFLYISHLNECSQANLPFRFIICKYNNINAYVCIDIHIHAYIYVYVHGFINTQTDISHLNECSKAELHFRSIRSLSFVTH